MGRVLTKPEKGTPHRLVFLDGRRYGVARFHRLQHRTVILLKPDASDDQEWCFDSFREIRTELPGLAAGRVR